MASIDPFMMATGKARGKQLVIHCNGGRHRSPAVAAAVLIYYGMMKRQEAIDHLQVHESFSKFLWNVEGLRAGGEGMFKGSR